MKTTAKVLRELSRDMRIRNFVRQIPPIRRLMWMRSASFDPNVIRAFDIARPYTMLSGGQLHNAVEAVRRVDREKIPGALVECGVWRGGCLALMAWLSPKRRTWGFDSFQGLPNPETLDGADAVGWGGQLEASEAIVHEVLAKIGAKAEIRRGWFVDTIPAAARDIGPIAVLRLDGDFYESTKVCLEHLYAQVSPDGVVIIDDYDRWEGCRIAVDEFLQSNGIVPKFTRISAGGGQQFIKPGQRSAP